MMERMEFDEAVEDTIMPLMATIENLESDSNHTVCLPMSEAIGLQIWMSKLQNLQSTSISLDVRLHLMNATRKSLVIPSPS